MSLWEILVGGHRVIDSLRIWCCVSRRKGCIDKCTSVIRKKKTTGNVYRMVKRWELYPHFLLLLHLFFMKDCYTVVYQNYYFCYRSYFIWSYLTLLFRQNVSWQLNNKRISWSKKESGHQKNKLDLSFPTTFINCILLFTIIFKFCLVEIIVFNKQWHILKKLWLLCTLKSSTHYWAQIFWAIALILHPYFKRRKFCERNFRKSKKSRRLWNIEIFHGNKRE